MAIVLDGSSSAGLLNLGTNGTISNLAVGGLPDGIVDTDMIAANAVTAAKRGAGAILQVIVVTKATSFGTTNTNHNGSHPLGDNIGGLTADITMTNASNKVLAMLSGSVSNSDTDYYSYFFLYRITSSAFTWLGSSVNKTRSGAHATDDLVINRLDTPAAGTHTYKGRIAAEGNTAYLGQGQSMTSGANDDRIGDGNLILMEIAV